MAAARHYAAEQLRDLAPEDLQVVLLAVSELATNAVRHAGTGFLLRLVPAGADALRIEVEDGGGGVPVAKMPPATALHGRGLLVVEALSSAWGVERVEGGVGKVVWAVVPA